jgi:hypothetical protein
MTTKEAFALVCETIERKLNETIRKWGYTVERDSDASWAHWQIVELDFIELVSIVESRSFLCLEILTNETAAIFPRCFPPKDIEAAVERHVSRALKVAALKLAYKELRNILGLNDACIWGSLSIESKNFVESGIRICLNQETFYITFRLNKKCWSWKITTLSGKPVTAIRRPLGENPIPVLCETVKCLGLLLL